MQPVRVRKRGGPRPNSASEAVYNGLRMRNTVTWGPDEGTVAVHRQLRTSNDSLTLKVLGIGRPGKASKESLS